MSASPLSIPSAKLPIGPADLVGRMPAIDATGKAGPAAAERAAKDFEAVLLHRVLTVMKESIPDSGLLSNGISRQVHDIFWMYLAEGMAEKGGVGLWKEIYAQMAPHGGGGAAPSAMEQLR